MTSRLNPYITFPGNAREAMAFYESVFGGTLLVSTFSEFGGAPEGLTGDHVMHANLHTEADFTLMASDAPLAHAQTAQSNITVSLSGDDPELLRGYWEALSTGGAVSAPLEKHPWGDEFGMCTDRFGIAWMVNISAPQG